MDQRKGTNKPGEPVDVGVYLGDYYPSVEWDIMDVPARVNYKKYPCCTETYPGN